MKDNLNKLYDQTFYSTHGEGMSRSSAIVLGMLFEHYKPRSVVDIGCGQGAWLAAAERLGVQNLTGMDGEWVNRDALFSKNIDFKPVNFDKAIPKLDEKYDLCISLEVAEHVSESKAKDFVDLLCRASDVVLFSAAIKLQGGTNHINEQWQSYWIKLFEANGFECLDILRGALWNDDSVEWWYKQNMFVFVRPDKSPAMHSLRALRTPVFDIAHPANYEEKINSYKLQIGRPTLRFCLGCIQRYILSKFRRAAV